MIIIPNGGRVRESALMIDTRTYIDASNVRDDDKPTIWFSGIHPLAGWQSEVTKIEGTIFCFTFVPSCRSFAFFWGDFFLGEVILQKMRKETTAQIFQDSRLCQNGKTDMQKEQKKHISYISI